MVVEQQERTLEIALRPVQGHSATECDQAFISQCQVIAELKAKIDLIAPSQASVLITGESGTGKEVVARLIHRLGSGPARPFVAINAAALPRDVVDNELFGHEKEAFTGAISKKMGCFELAHQGVLFLDEIAEMQPQTQAKLLRAIENKSFRRLGGREEVAVEVRIIAATNKNISELLKSGAFREDLFYRLSVIELSIPPLRERAEDIPHLIQHFATVLAAKYNKHPKIFSKDAMELLMIYDWPGNVRELRNLVERVMIVCSSDTVLPHQLPERISKRTPTRSCIVIPVGTSLEQAKNMVIEQTLAAVDQNKSAAARLLGVSRRMLITRAKSS